MKVKRKSIAIIISIMLISALFSLIACNGGENNPTELSAPEIKLTNNVISWEPIEHATSYEVYENGTKVSTQTQTSYTITQTALGTYSYTVKATSTDLNYTVSPSSNAVEYTLSAVKLATPNIALEGNVISWQPIEHATGYEVYLSDELISSPTQTEYTIEVMAAGEYKYSVRAISSDEKFEASSLSNEVTYIITVKLATPVIEIEGKVISWQEVENADFYAIYEDGYVTVPSYSETEYEITQTLVGTHTYSIMARSNKPNVFFNSDKSNEVSYEVMPVALATPSNLEVSGGRLNWDAVEGADKYIVYEDGIVVSEQSDNFYPLPSDHDTGTFVYTIKAMPAKNDKQYLESEISEPYSYVFGDDRQQLAEPSNLRTEVRQVNKVPDRPEEGTIEVLYLLWDAVANAESYFVYEDGNRIFATSSASYVIDEVMPGTHKYQVKAVSSSPNFKSSEISTSYAEYKIDTQNVDYTINLDLINAPEFNSDVTVELWMAVNGLPQTNTQKKVIIKAGEVSGIINFSNSARMGVIAKISTLPANYYASEIKLSAATTEGTISIYAKGKLPEIALNTDRNVTATGGESGNVGVEQLMLFVAPDKGQYALSGDGNAICTIGGVERRIFSADKGEAVLVGVNLQEQGKFTLKIAKAGKQYINFGEITYNGPTGGSNAIYEGDETTTFYMHANAEPKRYMFLFTTATMGNTRFVTLTINGEEYEFDGAYCTSINILIPASESEVTITARLTGAAPSEGMGHVYFFVIPL